MKPYIRDVLARCAERDRASTAGHGVLEAARQAVAIARGEAEPYTYRVHFADGRHAHSQPLPPMQHQRSASPRPLPSPDDLADDSDAALIFALSDPQRAART